MMRVILLVCLVSVAYGAQARRILDEDPNHPGKCVYGDVILDVGKTEPAKVGKCEEYSCSKDGQKLVFTISTCGVVAVRPGCRVGEVNNKLQYPACCPQLICDKN